jgi:hypothetical protein
MSILRYESYIKPSKNVPQGPLFEVFFEISTKGNGDSENDLKYSQSIQRSDLTRQEDMSISLLRTREEWFGLINAQLSEARAFGLSRHRIRLPSSLRSKISM